MLRVETKARVVVVGLGEVGKPLYALVSQYQETAGVDIEPVVIEAGVDVLHICYPFQVKDFVAETVRYIDRYKPSLTVINSTVAVGTTRAIEERVQSPVVNSPVRGKHARMLQDMQKYTKFVGATDPAAGRRAAQHFESLGLKTKVLSSPEATELAKLTETTYFGVMIAWAQEVERYCDKCGADYDQVVSFYEEIGFFPPVKYFPGVIGGHCVMQNIEILSGANPTMLLETIKASNEMKVERELRARKEEVLV
jgi:UDP-N-acetyl-D-mannosaminuronate dehydrogenase